ncbi:uncharacterized protein LOC112268725 [Brachypodium distachyon]|uniref:Uncharacterized protein n=1 Tax=Brachypodium distachyon TaxID=15368 RepID=I1GSG9_BRADI|nr:uncharacterized protein LOC112268725 [Brachypodium distachyon]KQK15305.1 hypothetical protein BRADI_1g21800v3 [Brachypodium distachyon]PNT74777.1 hypothetical protein BRADI_1g21800v3 [Brachypodium distachyon]|eukprot:XP_024310530.1 uncharacterized protein LOC112268725 [Brachypodium distachyon]
MKSVADHHYHGFHSPSPAPATKISIPVSAVGAGAEAALLGKGRYKACALAAIALLALWSMFAASVTLRWSSESEDLAATSVDVSDPFIDDLDPLEMEEREKLVRQMWDLYTRTGDHVWLPRFWQEAFEAAYEELAGDDTPASDAAISEIARMSVHRPELEQARNSN